MIERGQMRVMLNPDATSMENLIRSIPVPGYFVALTASEVATLGSLPIDEAKIAHLYANADGLWAGDDLLDVEDSWAAFQMALNRTPPVDEPFPWNVGEPPLRYAVNGTRDLLARDETWQISTYEVRLVEATWVPKIADALDPIGREDFLALYAAHCPPAWEKEDHVADRWSSAANFEKLKVFYRRHATTGKHLVFFCEL